VTKHDTSHFGEASSNEQLLEQVAAGVAGVGSNVIGLDTASDQLRSSAETAAARAESMASASDQVNRSMESIAGAIDEMATSLQDVARRTGETSTAVQQVVSDTTRAKATMSGLETSSQAIRKVANAIAAIARQTNMLALNATIEAARAGVAGKGFAVVASEVKELSTQTEEATRQIDRGVHALLDSVQQAITEIGESTSAVERIGQMTSEVATAVEEQTSTTTQIASSLTEVVASSETMAGGASELSTVVTATSRGAERIRRISGRIYEETEVLDGALRRSFSSEAPPERPVGPDAASQLAAAARSHGAWKATLLQALVAGTSDQDPDLVARDDRCQLGTWLYHQSTPTDRGSDHFEPLRELHAGFHELAARILRQAAGSDRGHASRAIAFGGEFDKLSAQLIDRINAWRDDLASGDARAR